MNASRTTLHENNLSYAQSLDAQDPLAKYRRRFLMPKNKSGEDCIYLAGHSLGLQPDQAKEYIDQELADWAKYAVEGHVYKKHPWVPYHEMLTETTANLVGAKTDEVVVMNSLTVNLHLMLVSFYRPTAKRFKILIESSAFPSDQYAVASQAKLHGYKAEEAIIELKPHAGEDTIRPEDIIDLLAKQGQEIAVVMLGNVNYLSGQAFDMDKVTKAAHEQGCFVGYNLAHGAGNLLLKLHDWQVDFAVWCSYKYLNAGPGAIAGCFVHEKHIADKNIPRLTGWWGHNKETRFQMPPVFDPINSAEAWQLSNPPIFQLAALRASMEIFAEASMAEIRRKSVILTGYLEYLLQNIPDNFCSIITPKNPEERGAQLSFRIKGNAQETLETLKEAGVICDLRNPNILRVAPIALYTKYADIFNFAQILRQCAQGNK